MKKVERDNYIFNKKCLLMLLYLYYINDVDFDAITLRSFGFHFDPTCNFKVIIKSKKEHIHKYVVHIFDSLRRVNFEELDIMGNVNIIKLRSLKSMDFYLPESSLNVYFDEMNLYAIGFIEGKRIEYKLDSDENALFKDELLYRLNRESEKKHPEDSFIHWLLKFYTSTLKNTLVLGAGINCDYGAKDWKGLIDTLSQHFYKNDLSMVEEIKHYAGNELFVTGKIFKSNGFDIYESLHDELYLFKEAKSFNDPDSTLYNCVNYIQNHKNINVITYNYDTNLEYLLKKRGLRYTTVYDDNSFCTKVSDVTIFHVHGLLPFDKFNEKKFTDSLIFNESEYFYLYNNPYSWNISKQMNDFTFNVCMFIGISLTDPNMKRLLELSTNYLKFNFIVMKKEKGYNNETYRDVTNYFFTYDLITIWVDEYEDIGRWLDSI